LAFLSFSSPTQYKGELSRAVGSASELHTLKNFPLNPLYDCWKRVKTILPAIPLKLTQRFFPRALRLEEMEEDFHWGVAPEVAEENAKGPEESPTVGV